MDGLKEKVSQWKRIRDQSSRKLYDIADSLERSRRKHVENKCSNAKTSIASDFMALGGLLLAPFSGGLTLTVSAAATGLAIGSAYSDHTSKNSDNQTTEKRRAEAREVLKQYNSKTNELLEIYKIIEKIDEMDIIVEVCDILLKIHHVKRTQTCVNISRTHISLDDAYENTEYAGLVGVVKAGGFMKSAVNSTETVMQVTCHAQRISRHTRLCKEIISVAKSVREISSSVKPDALAYAAKQYNTLTSISRPISQVTMLPNGVLRMNGMLSSTTGTGLNAVVSGSKYAVNSLKQTKNTLNAAVTAKSGKTTLDAVVNAQKTTQVTKSVSQAAVESDKYVRITRVSKTVKETSKISGTATKAASISKVGLGMNALAIAYDFYNLDCAEKEKRATPEEVKEIRATAKQLENELLDISIQIETFEEMYIEVYRVYEKTHIEKLYDFLEICHTKLNLKLPEKHH